MPTLTDVYQIRTDSQTRALRDAAKSLAGIEQSLKDQAKAGQQSEAGSRKAEGGLASLADAAIVAQGAVRLVSTALSGITGASSAIKDAIFETITANNLLSAQTGAQGAALEDLKTQARDLYLNAWGDSIDDTRNAVSLTNRILGDTGDELEANAERAIVMNDVFDKDFNETLRAVSNMTETFGGNAENAFDVIFAGLQKTGDPSDDLLDTFNEYGTIFAEMGFTAEETMGMLAAGLDNGAMNFDVLGDAVKEFDIRLKSGESAEFLGRTFEVATNLSEVFDRMNIEVDEEGIPVGELTEGTKALIESQLEYKEVTVGLSQETAALWDAYKDGQATSGEVMTSVIRDLAAIEDPLERAQLGVALFGTKFEDIEQAILSMDLSDSELNAWLDEIQGKSDEVIDTWGSGFPNALTAFKRKAKQTVIDFFLPKLETLVELSNEFITAFRMGLSAEGFRTEKTLGPISETFRKGIELGRQAKLFLDSAQGAFSEFRGGLMGEDIERGMTTIGDGVSKFQILGKTIRGTIASAKSFAVELRSLFDALRGGFSGKLPDQYLGQLNDNFVRFARIGMTLRTVVDAIKTAVFWAKQLALGFKFGFGNEQTARMGNLVNKAVAVNDVFFKMAEIGREVRKAFDTISDAIRGFGGDAEIIFNKVKMFAADTKEVLNGFWVGFTGQTAELGKLSDGFVRFVKIGQSVRAAFDTIRNAVMAIPISTIAKVATALGAIFVGAKLLVGLASIATAVFALTSALITLAAPMVVIGGLVFAAIAGWKTFGDEILSVKDTAKGVFDPLKRIFVAVSEAIKAIPASALKPLIDGMKLLAGTIVVKGIVALGAAVAALVAPFIAAATAATAIMFALRQGARLVAQFAESIGVNLGFVGDLLNNFTLTGFLDTFATIAETVSGMFQVGGLGGVANGLGNMIGGFLESIPATMETALPKAEKKVGNLFKKLWPRVGKVASNLGAFVSTFTKGYDKAVGKLIAAFGVSFEGLWPTIEEQAPIIAENLGETLGSGIREGIPKLVQALKAIAPVLVPALLDTMKFIFWDMNKFIVTEGIPLAAEAAFSFVQGFINGLFGTNIDVAAFVDNVLIPAFEGAFDRLRQPFDMLPALWEGIKTKAGDIFNNIGDTISGAFDDINLQEKIDAWDDIFNGVPALIDGLEVKIRDGLNGFATALTGIGLILQTNLLTPIRSAINSAKGKFGELVSAGANLIIGLPGALVGLGGSLLTNLTEPIKTAVNDAASALSGLLDSATGLDVAAAGTWVSTNLIEPLTGAIRTALVGGTDEKGNTTGIGAAFGNLGNVLMGMAGALLPEEALTWVETNILTPLGNAFLSAFGGGEDEEGGGTFSAIDLAGSILGSLTGLDPDMALGWVTTHVIEPLKTALGSLVGGDLEGAVEAGGEAAAGTINLVDMILNNVANFDAAKAIGWVTDNVITPIREAFMGLFGGEMDLGLFVNAVAGFGGSVVSALSSAVSATELRNFVQTNIIDVIIAKLGELVGLVKAAISAAIPDSINIDLGSIRVDKWVGPLHIQVDEDLGSINIPIRQTDAEDAAGAARGADFTVPGFGNRDSPHLLNLTPGERVTVIPKGTPGFGSPPDMMGGTQVIQIELDGEVLWRGLNRAGKALPS